jgi:hypothetical protein
LSALSNTFAAFEMLATVIMSVIGALIPFVIWAFAIYLILKAANGRLRRTTARGAAPASMDILAPIRETDPTFTWEAFCARATAAYQVVQRARMVQQPDIAREWVTPQLLTGLENAITFRGHNHVQRMLAPITVTGIGPVRVTTGGNDLLFDVRIVGRTSRSAANAILGVEDSRDESMLSNEADVDEIWTFRRKVGAQTTPEFSATACPSCGAPVKNPHAEACEYCGRVLRRVADDWTVAMVAPAPFVHPATGLEAILEGRVS